MPLRVIEYRQIIQVLTMFMLVQFFGMLLATQLFTGITFQEVQSTQVVSSSIDALFYVVYIVIFSAILLLIFKIYKGERLYLIFEGAIVLISSFVVFLLIISIITGSITSNLYGNGLTAVFVLSLLLSLALVVAKNKMPQLRNVTAIIASIGVGLVLGISFSFAAAFIFMVILAIYDFISVFITKHMLVLADAAVSKNLSFLVMVNEVEAFPVSNLTASQKKEYMQSKPMLEKQGGIAGKLAKSNMAPISARMALGTGDLAIPLMLAVAAYKVELNFRLSFVILFGAIFGLILTMFVLRRYKRALPAIPPLLIGITLAILVASFLGFV